MYKFSNISKTYNGIKILNNVSLEIEPASIQFLTGKSGTGKTSFLKILSGIESYEDTNGQTKFIDDDSIAYIPQVNSLWNNLTVEQNIILYRKLKLKESKVDALNNSTWLIESLNISDKLKRFPSKLSSGEHQRVAIARAIASNKNLILLDEITSNLDFENKTIIQKIINVAIERGKSFLFISHDLHFISQFADQCFVLENAMIKLQKITNYGTYRKF